MVRFFCDTSCMSNGQPVFLKDIMSTNLPYSSVSAASVINVTICLVALQLASQFVLVYDENGSQNECYFRVFFCTWTYMDHCWHGKYYFLSMSLVRGVKATGVFTLKSVLLCFYLHKVITVPHNIKLVLILFTSLICSNLEDNYFRRINEISFKDELNGKTPEFTQTNINCLILIKIWEKF